MNAIKYTGIFSICLGVIVHIGWYFNLPQLIQINNSFVPMQFNTALGFILSGICFLAIYFKKIKLLGLSSFFLFLLGFLTISQYVVGGLDLGIDQLLMDHYITVKTSHPGRMAPNTALSFLLLSLISFVEILLKGSRRKNKFVMAISSQGAALATIAFIGYLFQIEGAYGWQKLTRMAVHTSFGFLALFLSLIYAILSIRKKTEYRYLPIFVSMGVLVVFTLAGQTIKETESSNIRKVVESESKLFSGKVETVVGERLSAYQRLSERIVFLKKNREFWDQDTQTYYRDFGFFYSFIYADENNIAKWVFPEDRRILFLGTSFVKRNDVMETIKRSIRERKVVVSNTFELSKDKYGMLFVFPLFLERTYIGSSIGVVDLKKFFDTIYGNIKNPSYGFEVIDGDRKIYSSSLDDLNGEWSSSSKINELNWELKVFPSQSYVDSLSSVLGEIIVLLGLIITIFSGLITYFYQLSVIARKKAEVAKEAKSNFLASMSHEIRTPLNGVLGMTSLLHNEKLSEEGQKYLSSIETSGESLRILINDILDLSKIEAGKLSLEENDFSPIDIVKQTTSLFYGNAKEKGIRIVTDCEHKFPSYVRTDSNRVKQVLSNLLSNAVKFSEEGEVKISGSYIASEGDEVIIQIDVRDNGIGIKEEDQAKLFQLFEQADNSISRKFGGTGLGLAISKSICVALGGDIWVESEVGSGSTFSFTFKAIKSDKPSVVKEMTQKLEFDSNFGKERPFRILVVDDNNVNQMVAKKFLIKLGYNPDLAGNGLEAVEATKSKDYDLIFMDGQMPELDGYEASKRIREELPKEKQPWIIAFTASTSSDDKKRCEEAGMDDFLGKPISLKALIDSLEKAFQNR